MKTNLLPIAKEGFQYIAYAIFAIFLFSIFDFGILEFFALLLSAFFIHTFRNPEREAVVFEQNSVVSPVDGKLISIDELKDNKEFSYKLQIDSSYLDVSLLRAPLTSTLMSIDEKSGSRLSRFSPLFEKINENTTLVFEDNNKNILKLSHTLKQSFAPIKVDITEGKKLFQGSRYGLMLSGVTTIYLPQNFRISASVGAEVKASQTLIGYFS